VSIQQFGRYQLLEKIGIGGMAEVWKARVFGVGGFEKILVVKKILPQFSQHKNFIDMLLAEGRICALLQHANVVQTFENGEIDGNYFIAMEYCNGRDLLKVLARATQLGRRMPEEIALFVAAEVAKGLAYAHAATDNQGTPLRIIHRDVSPSNVILGFDGDVKIMDFGVARAARGNDDHKTRAGDLKGKLGYMSPEQVTGQPYDHRSDIFSLGIVLYEALTLKRLFLGKTDLETLVNIRDARIEHKFAKHDYIPEGVRAILRKALARDPAQRYATASEMHDAIMDYLFEAKRRVNHAAVATYMRELFQDEKSTPIPPAPPTPPQDGPVPPGEIVPEEERVEEIASQDMLAARQDASRRHAQGPQFVMREVSPPPQGRPTPVKIETTAPQRRPSPPPVPAQGGVPMSTSAVNRGPRDTQEMGPSKAADFDEMAAPVSAPFAIDVATSSAHRMMAPDLSSRSREALVRVRTGDGQVLGPVTIQNLDALVRAQTVRRGDLVSVNGGPFRPIEEVTLLRDTIGLPTDGASEVPSQTGTISQLGMPKLIYLLSTKRATGRLKLTRNTIVKDIFWRRGQPVHVASNQKSELLGAFLVAKGFVAQVDIDAAIDRSTQSNSRLGDVLIAMNIIKPHELYQILNQQFREKIVDIFSWDAGLYAFYDGTPPPPDAVPLDMNPIPILTEGVREKLSLSALEPFLTDFMDRRYVQLRNPGLTVDALRLSSRETRSLQVLLGSGTLREALDKQGGARPMRLSLLQTMFLLLQLELLKFEPRG